MEQLLEMAKLIDRMSTQTGQMLDVILKLEKRIVVLERTLFEVNGTVEVDTGSTVPK
jgi:hypothetical protein